MKPLETFVKWSFTYKIVTEIASTWKTKSQTLLRCNSILCVFCVVTSDLFMKQIQWQHCLLYISHISEDKEHISVIHISSLGALRNSCSHIKEQNHTFSTRAHTDVMSRCPRQNTKNNICYVWWRRPKKKKHVMKKKSSCTELYGIDITNLTDIY